jgi:hypothetical protein
LDGTRPAAGPIQVAARRGTPEDKTVIENSTGATPQASATISRADVLFEEVAQARATG